MIDRDKIENDAKEQLQEDIMMLFSNKSLEQYIDKYIEARNIVTRFMNKYNKGKSLKEREWYDFYYNSELERTASGLIADRLSKTAGYTRNKDGLWIKE